MRDHFDCGCWTDSEGYWRLSPECLDLERKQWADMMDRFRVGDYRPKGD